jgi:hypothetical protein
MRSPARFMLMFSLGVWIGSIIFFSFIVAPMLFAMLPRPETAGEIVRMALTDLHLLGIACGALFLIASFVIKLRRATAMRLLVGLMLVLTVISLFGIMPKMERIRDAVGGSIEALPPKDAGRAAFDRLHEFSVAVEGVVLLAGISTMAVLSREAQQAD